MTYNIPLTAVILTKNEAVNIRECIARLSQVNDVILVDSDSTDDTVTIAREERPGVRIFHRRFTDFGDQRNWALDNTSPRHDWILFVDADEFCDDEFLEELVGFLSQPGEFVGAFVAGKNYFLGQWLKHSTMYPSYQLRLLKRGEVRFRKQGHGQAEVTAGRLHYLKHGWRHEAFSKGLSQWLDRHNKYTSEEALYMLQLRSKPIPFRRLFSRDPVNRRRAIKLFGSRLPARPLLLFLYLYVFRLGFLDGYPGWLYCILVMTNQFITVAKQRELAVKMKDS
jgi:glycosyltransferase involved in cell wall biosynthesis